MSEVVAALQQRNEVLQASAAASSEQQATLAAELARLNDTVVPALETTVAEKVRYVNVSKRTQQHILLTIRFSPQ